MIGVARRESLAAALTSVTVICDVLGPKTGPSVIHGELLTAWFAASGRCSAVCLPTVSAGAVHGEVGPNSIGIQFQPSMVRQSRSPRTCLADRDRQSRRRSAHLTVPDRPTAQVHIGDPRRDVLPEALRRENRTARAAQSMSVTLAPRSISATSTSVRHVKFESPHAERRVGYRCSGVESA